MISEGHYGVDDIKLKIGELQQHWQKLKVCYIVIKNVTTYF